MTTSLADIARMLLPPGRAFTRRAGSIVTFGQYGMGLLLVPHAEGIDREASFPSGSLVYVGAAQRPFVIGGWDPIQPWQTNVTITSVDPSVPTWTELQTPGDQPVAFASGVEVGNGGVAFVAAPGVAVYEGSNEVAGSALGVIIDGATDELQRIDDVVRALASETLPADRLSVWARALGLDDALAELELRARIVARLIGRTDGSRAAYEAAASALGLAIADVRHFSPFEAGRSAAGAYAWGDDWMHVVELVVGALPSSPDAGDVLPGTGTRAHGFAIGVGMGPWGSVSDADMLTGSWNVVGPIRFDCIAVHRPPDAIPVVELRAQQVGIAGNLPWDAIIESSALPNGYSSYRSRGPTLAFNENGFPIFEVNQPFAGGTDALRVPPQSAIDALQRIVDTELHRAHTLVRVVTPDGGMPA